MLKAKQTDHSSVYLVVEVLHFLVVVYFYFITISTIACVNC